jgi:hypothetical protein
MRSSARVCDPVRVSICVGRASEVNSCAEGELGDLGAVGRCSQGRRGGGAVRVAGLCSIAVGAVLLNGLLHVLARAVLLVARVLAVPFAGAEAALNAWLVLAGQLSSNAQVGVTKQGEEGWSGWCLRQGWC